MKSFGKEAKAFLGNKKKIGANMKYLLKNIGKIEEYMEVAQVFQAFRLRLYYVDSNNKEHVINENGKGLELTVKTKALGRFISVIK